jgi:accessory gene regulator B
VIKISLEEFSHKIVEKFFLKSGFSEIELAKIEYGLSLILGILIEFFIVFSLGLMFKIGYYVAVIMLSSLFLRITTGGAHCSTYRRCLTFTGLYFLPVAFTTKYLDFNLNFFSKGVLGCALIFLVLGIIFLRKRSFALFMLVVFWAVFSGIVSVKLFFVSSVGFFLQSLMITSFGEKLVEISDEIMKKVGI